jgi:DNA polymerase IV
MKKHAKRIVFIYIPHFFVESEKLRKKWDNTSSCVVASGDAAASMIIDLSEDLAGTKLRKGMLLKNARRIKRDFNVITVDYDYMKETGDMITDYLKTYSIIVESADFGEFYIDLTGTERLFGRVMDTCLKIISELNERYGFNLKIGIGSNKLISHLAAKLCGSNSVYEICGPEDIFLAPAKIAHIPDIRPETKSELRAAYNIQSMRDLQKFSRSDLEAMFSKDGSILYSYSRNIAADFLSAKKEERVIARSLILSDEPNDDTIIRRRFFNLALELCAYMRKQDIVPLYFDLKIIYKDNYKYIKSRKLESPTFIEKKIYTLLLPYLDAALSRRTCINKIVLTFSKFVPAAMQGNLFGYEDRDLSLCRAFDSIRDKYGKRAIYFSE